MIELILAGLVGAVLLSSKTYYEKEKDDNTEKIILPSEEDVTQNIKSENNNNSLTVKNNIKSNEAIYLTFRRQCIKNKNLEVDNFKKQLISCGCIINSVSFENTEWGIYSNSDENYCFIIKVLADATAIKKLKDANLN